MKFQVVKSGEAPFEFTSKSDEFIVGRGKDCDLRIISEGVSRQHARIYTENDKVFIEDLGSSNGTFINEEKVTRSEVTTFFPVYLGPLVTLNLMDDSLPTNVSGQVTNTITPLENVHRQRTVSSTPLPPRNTIRRRASSKKSTTGNKSQIMLAFILLVFSAVGIATFFLSNDDQANTVVHKKNSNVTNTAKFKPAKLAMSNITCSSTIGSCLDFELESEQREGLLLQDGVLYLFRNFDHFPPEEVRLKDAKLNESDKLKAIAYTTFFRSKVFSRFTGGPEIQGIVITVFKHKFDVTKNYLELKIKKKEEVFLKNSHAKYLHNFSVQANDLKTVEQALEGSFTFTLEELN